MLREHYESQDTEELVALWCSELTSDARAVLRDVLSSRGVPESELAEAQAAEITKQEVAKAEMRDLASRTTRLIAFLIDVIAVSLTAAAIDLLWLAVAGYTNRGFSNLVGGVLFGYMLVRDAGLGISIGKRLLRIRVVDRESNRMCTFSQSLWRNLPLILTIDWLFIFGSRRTRLGDIVANTKVVRRVVS